MIPAAGWLGDRFGTKRVFIVALVIFVAMSLLCGVAQSLDQLVFFRILQGAGGGLVTPVGSAMLYRAFPMAERATAAIGVLSVTVIAPAIGPMLGGLLVDEASWRWIFLINVPVGIATVVLSIVGSGSTSRIRPARRRRDEHVDVDVDRAPRPLRAPRQRERATERVRQPGAVERAVHAR